jgi:chromate reductase
VTNGAFRILGIAGSLRRGSFNRGLLRAATEVAPDGVEIETFELGSIPLYNEDVRVAGEPAVVGELKERIRSADALLITTPEYNYSVPGVLTP